MAEDRKELLELEPSGVCSRRAIYYENYLEPDHFSPSLGNLLDVA
jgi:hypothetical protein